MTTRRVRSAVEEARALCSVEKADQVPGFAPKHHWRDHRDATNQN